MSIEFTISYIVLWVLIVALSLIAIEVLRRVAEIHTRLTDGVSVVAHGLAIGSPAPPFAGVDIRTGQTVQLRDGGAHTLTAVLFFTAQCRTCQALADACRTTPRDRTLRIIAVCLDPIAECRTLLTHLPADIPLLSDAERALHKLYRASVPPSVVIVDADGRVRITGTPPTFRHLMELFDRASGEERRASLEVTSATA
jgi:peroxiredoxin